MTVDHCSFRESAAAVASARHSGSVVHTQLNQSIAPSRLSISTKDGLPHKLGAGGFGQVTHEVSFCYVHFRTSHLHAQSHLCVPEMSDMLKVCNSLVSLDEWIACQAINHREYVLEYVPILAIFDGHRVGLHTFDPTR